MPAQEHTLATLLDDMSSTIVGIANKFIELQARVVAVEEKSMEYRGVYQRADDYARGDIVTHHGSAWVAVKASNAETPGDSNAWQLMVQRGRDGKDAGR